MSVDTETKTLTAERLAYWRRSPGRRFAIEEWHALIDLALCGLRIAELAELDRYRRVAMRAQEYLLTPHRRDRAEALAAALAAVGMKVGE